MSSAATSLEDVLIETGVMAKAEAKAEARGEAKGEARATERTALSIAENMIKLGLPLETIVAATKLDPEKVKALYNN